MTYMKGLEDKAFDLAIVDPPYGIGQDGRNQSRGFAKLKGRTPKFIKSMYANKDWDSYKPGQLFFDELFRVSKNQIIWGENYQFFNQKNNSTGRIVWDKVNGDTNFSDCEIAWTSCRGSVSQIEYMWSGMFQGKSFKNGRVSKSICSTLYHLREHRIHPTQKPVELYKWILCNYAKYGYRILDTHLGSGSSAIAAHSMGFDFVGTEIDKDYYDAACKRFKEQTMQQKLFI